MKHVPINTHSHTSAYCGGTVSRLQYQRRNKRSKTLLKKLSERRLSGQTSARRKKERERVFWSDQCLSNRPGNKTKKKPDALPRSPLTALSSPLSQTLSTSPHSTSLLVCLQFKQHNALWAVPHTCKILLNTGLDRNLEMGQPGAGRAKVNSSVHFADQII